jgi:hypothetical protein
MSRAVEQTGTAPASQQSAKVPTVDAFRARCEARAWLVAEGELTLPDAVDELQASAVASGIVDMVGQDRVQQLMAAAFEAVWGRR